MADQTCAAPRRPAALNGAMWGITTYFNPVGYSNKAQHLQAFCEGVLSQGLKLLIVEAAFRDQPFALPESSADLIIRVRPLDVLWQKERLLNIALDCLPRECDKVAWLDADIILENEQWARETSRMLEEVPVVQPYDVAWWFPPGVRCPPSNWSGNGFAQVAHGLAYIHTHAGRYPSTELGHPGFAWVARRSLLERHHFYDRLILGGADIAMCWAMYDRRLRAPIRQLLSRFWSPAQIAHFSTWKERFYADVQGKVGYLGGRVFHLWHGSLEDRQYLERQLLLKEADFDPNTDIALDSQLCWRWNSDKPGLHAGVKEYFYRRKEGQVLQPIPAMEHG